MPILGMTTTGETPVPRKCYTHLAEGRRPMDNILYYGDNLDVMREHLADESVDLVYLDPPFNSARDYSPLAGSSLKRAGAKPLARERDQGTLEIEP